MRVLFVGPQTRGGEGVYVESLLANPPAGTEYVPAGGFHEGAPGALCRLAEEALLNRLVRRWTIPDMGMRSLTLGRHFDLVHVHAHPVRLGGLGETPLVMSEGSSSAVYLGDYLGWSEERLARAYTHTKRVYRALRIHDRLLNLDRVDRAFVFSHWARDLNVRWGADPAKLDVVYPGFPTPTPPDRSCRDTFTFLFVGTDFERKGGFELVDAFDIVHRRNRSARLIVVSPDPAIPDPDRRRVSTCTRACHSARAGAGRTG
jgi:glycosyltransferase involved in cell wall biosynthesis